jgi:hypothetical protein
MARPASRVVTRTPRDVCKKLNIVPASAPLGLDGNQKNFPVAPRAVQSGQRGSCSASASGAEARTRAIAAWYRTAGMPAPRRTATGWGQAAVPARSIKLYRRVVMGAYRVSPTKRAPDGRGLFQAKKPPVRSRGKAASHGADCGAKQRRFNVKNGIACRSHAREILHDG